MLGHSRNTISKYLEADVFTEPKYNLTVVFNHYNAQVWLFKNIIILEFMRGMDK